MPIPLFLTSAESTKEFPILLLDKDGEIAFALCESLKKTTLTVVVSRTKPTDPTIVHLPFTPSLPRLPNNAFAGIIVIYNGEKAIVRKLPELLKKAKETNAPLLFVCDRHNGSEALFKKVTTYANGKVVLYGDLFGVSSIHSNASMLLMQAAKKQHILLPNSGLSLMYPLAFQDLIYLLLELLLGQSPFNFYFLSSKPRTQLSFVRLLQNIEPLIKVDFTQKKRRDHAIQLPKNIKHIHPLTMPLQERLRDALGSLYEQEERIMHFTKKVKRKRTRLEKVTFFVVLLVILPVITIVAALSVGFASLGVSALSFERGNLALAEKAAFVSFQSFEVARPSEEIVTTLAERINMPITFIPYIDHLASGRKSAELLLAISRAALLLEKGFIQGKFPQGETVRVLIKKAVFALQELQAQEFLPKAYREKMRKDERAISLLSNIIDKTPLLFGYEGKKTYAILLQDNTELRAGGGAIRSVGILTLLNGQFVDFQLTDVYTLDGELKGHKDPPFFLRRYLGASHWFLRDSNVSLDSARNATEAARFIELETGKRIDGIITTDLTFLRTLLKEIGPLEVGQKGEAISSNTLFSQAVATQNLLGDKKENDFFVTLPLSIVKKLDDEPLSPLILGRLIAQGIWQKHVLLTSLDPTVQPLLLRSKGVSTPSQFPHSDHIGIVENNIGGNSANYFLKRSIMHSIVLKEDKSASESVSLLYSNTASEDSGEGEYLSYVHLLLPANSELISIEVNGTPQVITPAITDPDVYLLPDFKTPKGLEVAEETLYGKQVYSFLLTVKEKEERLVHITYTTRNITTSQGSQVFYHLSYFKQPGREQDDYTVSLTYPKKYRPVRAPEGTIKSQETLLIEKLIKEDEIFKFEFATRN